MRVSMARVDLTFLPNVVVQVLTAAPVLAMALVRHHAVTAAIAVLLTVLSFSRRFSLARARCAVASFPSVPAGRVQHAHTSTGSVLACAGG